MGRKFYYPIDNDQFAEIREQGRVYIDKTGMLYDIVSMYKYVFLSRPRRFGKSLLCNTFKAYFQGRRELFDGLAIAGLEKEWKKYPVFHFTISGLKNLTVDEALAQIDGTGYAIPWSADGRRLIKCGAIIDSSKRNLTRWRVVDEAGTVMKEQDFRKQ